MSGLFETWSGDDDEVILQMVRLIGKLPEPWWAAWDSRSRWFEEDGTPIVYPDEEEAFATPTSIEKLLPPGVHSRMTSQMGRPIDITVPLYESQVLGDLLLQMLKYDPRSRLTIEAVLNHPWFKL